jgi:formamidopyrimidine-DNA glycosylase
MFELPEYCVLSRQINNTLQGKVVQKGSLGNSPHKFVWYNQTPQDFERLTHGKIVGKATSRGRWMFIPLKPGYVLVFGECGGKILFQHTGSKVPKKYHLYITFEDNSFLTAITRMWGAMELYRAGEEQKRQYIKNMRPTPVDSGFTFDYFSALIDEVLNGPRRSVKSLLTQDQLIPGLGNAIAQDIMFRARLHPRRNLGDLTHGKRRDLHTAIIDTVREVMEKGGRNDECDLYGHNGGYARIMDSKAAGKPCPVCGRAIEKIQYLGGACYFCPQCQK